ncbi:MAG: anaerobic ribonucleoside-triphosphate reductase activating protein [Kiritimatiellaeota bacterium]|nr:anaerobic ribonucleoside-triphosphate reductase activating protein [Kiritimatiellota bacterium]
MSDERSAVYGVLKSPSLVDFPGRLSAVFFVSGCNFRCGFCHNAELLGTPKPGMPVDQLEAACGRFRDNWVDGAVITGGEPTLDDRLADLIVRLRKWGFKIKLDTNGSRPEFLATVLPLVDFVAMDVKCSLESYPEFVKFDHPERIARSVELVRREARAYEFRTTVLPAFHSDAEMRRIADLVRGARRFALQAFVPRDNLPDRALRRAPRTSPERLQQVAALVADSASEVVVRGA